MIIVWCIAIGLVAALVSFVLGFFTGAYCVVNVPDMEKALLKEENAWLKCLRSMEIVQRKRGTPKSVPMSPVAYLARLAQHMPVTVLCWEREVCQGEEHPRCHRFTLVEMVKQEMVK